MPKKLLLIKEAFQNLQKKLPRLNLGHGDSRTEIEPTEIPIPDENTLGSNLLEDVGINPFLKQYLPPKNPQEIKQYYHSSQFTITAQVIVIFTTALVLFSFLLNLSINKSIKQEEKVISEKAQNLEMSGEGYLNLKQISSKIAIHKQYMSEFNSVSSVLDLFTKDLLDFEYKSFSLTDKRVSISAQVGSPLSFSLMTAKYLDSGLVDQVILRNASLEKSSQKYNLGMEVILK